MDNQKNVNKSIFFREYNQNQCKNTGLMDYLPINSDISLISVADKSFT
jgi:hypothetical protein